MAVLSLEQYLDVHPMAAWNRDSWDERDAMVDTRFHEMDIHFTPMADYMAFPTGVGLNQKFYTGRQLVQANANQNPLGWYQRYTDSIYVDIRERALVSRLRYGGKAQYDKFDELVTRFGNDSDGFIAAVMNQQLLNNVVVVHEKLARDATLNFATNMFLGNKAPLVVGTADLDDVDGSGDFMLDVTYLDEMARRFMVRSMETRRKYGDYANPVPGENFRSNVLVMVPSLVYADIWESPARDWLVDLRQLDDTRIINSAQPAFQYRNITIADYGMELSLWNAGRLLQRLSVDEPIGWGDGAPDPAVSQVDDIWYTGQEGTNVKHYIHTATTFTDSNWPVGDMIALHVKTTDRYGVTGGVDVTDGRTIMCEIESTDGANKKVVVRVPVTEQYDKTVAPGVFAYLTRAQHIYPVYTIGARGYMKWAGREKITWNKPNDEEADFPSIVRVTWQERGEMNPWALDDYEIVFCEAKYAGRHGGVSIR